MIIMVSVMNLTSLRYVCVCVVFVAVGRFYIALFSALGQSYGALVACDSK